MPWVRFTKRFDYTLRNHRGAPTTSYREGMVIFLTRDRAAAAIEAGAAEKAENPRKGKRDGIAAKAADGGDEGADGLR